MLKDLVDLLVCPACRQDLISEAVRESGRHVDGADVGCTRCGARYEVREGIGLFLPPDSEPPARDLWEEAGGFLSRLQRDAPDRAAQLLDVPHETLGAADQFFRAMLLEEQGRFAEADVAFEHARPGLYTEAMRRSADQALNDLVARVHNLVMGTAGPVVDVACGRGQLLTRLLGELGSTTVVGTDLSIRVLRRNQRYLAHLGMADRVNLLASDARHMPFRDRSAAVLTTYVGLDNISPSAAVADVLTECRRITGRAFLAICQAEVAGDQLRWPPAGGTVGDDPAAENITSAGFQVRTIRSSRAAAQPTPASVVLDGATIDAFPEHATEVQWSVLLAEPG